VYLGLLEKLDDSLTVTQYNPETLEFLIQRGDDNSGRQMGIRNLHRSLSNAGTLKQHRRAPKSFRCPFVNHIPIPDDFHQE
jgi:hypothetical protein